jgi:hypothetical protein
MPSYTPLMKKNIQEALKKMNEKIKEAKAQVRDGKYRAAAQTVADIIDLKHDAVCSFPGIEPKPGVMLPFFPIFDTFEELDRQARRIWPFYVDLDMGKKPNENNVNAYIAKLKALIDELQRGLIDRPKLGDATGAEFIKGIIEELKKMIKQAEDAKAPDAKKESDDHSKERRRVLEKLHTLKHDYLAAFPSPIPLGNAYDALFLIDESLWYCLPYLQNPGRIDDAIIDRLQHQLDEAEHLKKHLEDMVDKSVTKDE